MFALPADLALELLGVLRAEAAGAAASTSPERAQRRLSAAVGELAEALDEALLDGALTLAEREQLAGLLRRVEGIAGAEAQALVSGE